MLEDDPDPLPVRRAGLPRVDAEHLDVATVALPVALQDLDRRRLPRAVRSEEPEDLARLDVEVDSPDGLVLAVGLAQRADRDRGGAGAHASSSSGNESPTWKPGSLPVTASMIPEQSGWWQTAATGPARPATAARRESAVAPGRELIADEDVAAEPLGDRFRGLTRAGQWAREHGSRGLVEPGESLREELRAVPACPGQLPELVGLAGLSLGVATEVDAHPRRA